MIFWKNNNLNENKSEIVKIKDYFVNSEPTANGALIMPAGGGSPQSAVVNSMSRQKTSRWKRIILLAMVLAGLAGIGGIFYWNTESFSLAGVLGFDSKKSNQLAFWKMLPNLIGFSGEKTYLVLFQNNTELRPAGGYLGNFGIIKVEDGRVTALGLHDTNIFDGFSKIQTEPPFPIEDYLGQSNWQMRDSNWSPDFATAAKQAEYFYKLQGGQEQFDGIIGVNASILPKLLEITGPITLEEFNEEFKAEDVLSQLQYEVEMGYWQDRKLEAGQRKDIFKALVKEILSELNKKIIWNNQEIRDLALSELENKDIQLYFKNEDQQNIIVNLGYAGEVNQTWSENYLMLSEANLGGKKSNTFVTRTVTYQIDYSKQKPEVELQITYTHSNPNKDWMNEDYRCYLKVYVPAGSWLVRTVGADGEVRFLDELNKTVFGVWVNVPAGQTKTVAFKFLLKSQYKESDQILVQKQSGVAEIPFSLTAIYGQGIESKLVKIIKTDWIGQISKPRE